MDVILAGVQVTAISKNKKKPVKKKKPNTHPVISGTILRFHYGFLNSVTLRNCDWLELDSGLMV